MKTTIKKLPKSEVEMEIEVEAKEFAQFIDRTVLDLGKNLEIQGFRKGYLPKEIIEEKIGKERILAEAAERAIKEGYPKAVLENNIEAISQPEIKILKLAPGNPFVFKARTAVLPEIQLPDYQKIAAAVKRNSGFSVEEKEAESALNWLQKSRAKITLKNQPAQEGDWVDINFSSPQIEGGKSRKDSFILGQGQFVPGFEENLKGMKDGEEKSFKVKFPDNYFHQYLSGKEVNFKVKMNSVNKMELPELTDEWARSLGEFENLEGLKKSISEGLLKEKENQEKERVRQEILEKISQKSLLEIPEILIASEKKQMLENLKNGLSQSFKEDFEVYLKKINKTEEELLNDFTPKAKENVKKFLILREIGKRENIKASKEEIEEEINRILKQFPNPEAAKRNLDPEKLKEYTENIIKNEKTFQLLESFVKI